MRICKMLVKYIKRKFNMEEAKDQRNWHPDFKNYTEFIVSHKNYDGLFFQRKTDGSVKWVIAGKSPNGLIRRDWWDKQCENHGIKLEAGSYAKIALLIHPTKLHTCQICRTSLSLEYVYPNSRTLLAMNKYFNVAFEPYTLNIFEIIEQLGADSNSIDKFKEIFKINKNVNLDKESLKKYIMQVIVGDSAS